jgi:hypothetical protein
VAAVVLLAGSAQGARLSKKEYIGRVNAIERSIDPDALKQLINREFISNPRLRSRPDDIAPRGADWIRKEHRFRTEALSFAGRLQRLKPPMEVSALHARWISDVRSCVGRIDGMVRQVPGPESGDIYNPSSREFRFDWKVARASKSCDVRKVCDEFDEKGYSFD